MEKKPGKNQSLAVGHVGEKTRGVAGDQTGIESISVACESQLDPWQTPFCKLPVSLAYAAVVDVRDAERVITDSMVMQACQEIEPMQQFPFAPRKSVQAG